MSDFLVATIARLVSRLLLGLKPYNQDTDGDQLRRGSSPRVRSARSGRGAADHDHEGMTNEQELLGGEPVWTDPDSTVKGCRRGEWSHGRSIPANPGDRDTDADNDG